MLSRQLDNPPPRQVNRDQGLRLLDPIEQTSESTGSEAKLAILCRTVDQVRWACQANADLIYADFSDIRLYGDAVRIAREHDKSIGLASVRMQKPGEMGLLKVLGRHRPDWLLARNLAAIDHGRRESIPVIADFSLNVANHRSAEWIRSLGAVRVTASYDLNRDQLSDLFDSLPAAWMEVVIHQHMPMFHMEHCVFCSVLSPGTNKTNCGRPCDDHVVQLRDRVGAEHTLQADVACRNTLYNATPQSGAETVAQLVSRGTRWFRIELLEEDMRSNDQNNHDVSPAIEWGSDST